ncbi:MAG: type VI secretion system contractile sheath large subunit, partial [Gammaproteobacteria bacterium]|nr:type VI secretion system contractile sheath large subunit [Gammaproteobacteria bacterium]
MQLMLIAQQKIITALISQLDKHINHHVNAVLHHPVFQRLESTWRGLLMLVNEAKADKHLLIRFLNVTYHELNKDVSSASEFDQSQLFKKIYCEELDQPGGQPFGLLIGDYYFSHQTKNKVRDDIGLLGHIGKIAAAAFAPFVSAVDPSMLGLDCFNEIQSPFKINTIFQLSEYQRWQTLRQDDDARFIGLTLPRILIPKPYNHQGVAINHRFFKESIEHHGDYLWGNAAYAYGCVVIKCFQENGWLADIRGLNTHANSGGNISLLHENFHTDAENIAVKCSTEYYITDNQEKIFSEAGFIALRDNRF